MVLHKIIKFSDLLVISVVCVSFVLSANLYTDRTQQCDKVTEFLRSIHLVTDTGNNEPGPLCGSHCCGPSAEDALLTRAADDFKRLLSHFSEGYQGMLDSAGTTLKEHVLVVIGQSENRTLSLLDTVYRRPPRLGHPPVAALYDAIRTHVIAYAADTGAAAADTTTTTMASVVGGDGKKPPTPLDKAVREFFERLFPLAYHHIAHSRLTDFTEEYKQCLMRSYLEVQPFGDADMIVSMTLRRALQATRLLLRALNAGVEILRDADTQLSVEQDKECLKALAAMTYCSKCKGHETARPCAGYCLNVVRGCLAARVDGLDAPWNAYLDALRRLAATARTRLTDDLNMERVLSALDGKVSQAIMGAMEHGPELKTRVRKVCGHSALVPEEKSSVNSSSSETTAVPSDGTATHVVKQPMVSATPPPPPDGELLRTLAAAHESRAFYARTADTLCRDEAFAETSEDGARECWTGQRLGEYTATVADAGPAAQRYNPEVAYRQGQEDPQIAELADRLRRITAASLTGMHEVGVYGTEAGGGTLGDPLSGGAGGPGDLAMSDMAPDGSGSGRGDWNDDDDDWREGSGSGDGPDGDDLSKVKIDRVTPIESNEVARTSAASCVKIPSNAAAVLVSLTLAVNVLLVR